MYKSPIRIITSDLGMKVTENLNEQIYQSVLNFGIDVDKGELLRALQYDRGQYAKGYADGKADAMADLVHCRDCQHWKDGVAGCADYVKCCEIGFYMVGENGYCCYGERKDNER